MSPKSLHLGAMSELHRQVSDTTGVFNGQARHAHGLPVGCVVSWLACLIHPLLNVAADLHELIESERFAEHHAVANHGRIVFL